MNRDSLVKFDLYLIDFQVSRFGFRVQVREFIFVCLDDVCYDELCSEFV